jgi:hypothetical protein
MTAMQMTASSITTIHVVAICRARQQPVRAPSLAPVAERYRDGSHVRPLDPGQGQAPWHVQAAAVGQLSPSPGGCSGRAF